jgi:hypothetical protein
MYTNVHSISKKIYLVYPSFTLDEQARLDHVAQEIFTTFYHL